MELIAEREVEELHSDSDEFGTPDYLFDPLNKEFHFTIDAAASVENYKLPIFFTKEDDALSFNWVAYARAREVEPIFWCNPPYSRGLVDLFVRKSYEESLKGATVVMLLPARTEQPWFHDIVLPYAEVRFVRKRVHFVGGKTSARWPSLIAIFPKKRLVNQGWLANEARCVA